MTLQEDLRRMFDNSGDNFWHEPKLSTVILLGCAWLVLVFLTMYLIQEFVK